MRVEDEGLRWEPENEEQHSGMQMAAKPRWWTVGGVRSPVLRRTEESAYNDESKWSAVFVYLVWTC